jgi:hypothetical protein
VFTPVLAKHTKSFNLVDTLSVGVDRIQRFSSKTMEMAYFVAKFSLGDFPLRSFSA